MTSLPESRTPEDEVTARLMALDQPAAVAGVAGEWLASRLADDGFTWARSLAKLERRIGVRREQIYLQNSKWNRTGERVTFGAVLNVRDGGLRKWRRANPGLTDAAPGNDDWLCGHPLGTLTGTWRQAQVDLTTAGTRGDHLDAFVHLLRTVALPWFAASRTPEQIAVELPDVTVDLFVVDLVEWMVCTGNHDEAAALVQRWLTSDTARRPEFDDGVTLARRGERPGISTSQWTTVGWSSAVLGLT
jgi:hypothetical protein